MSVKYPNVIQMLTPEEVKNELGIEISSPLIVAQKKDMTCDTTIKDIEKELETVKRIMNEYREKALNVIRKLVNERQRIAEYYRKLLESYGVDGHVEYDKIYRVCIAFDYNYECVYEGSIYEVLVVRDVHIIEKPNFDVIIGFKGVGLLYFDIIDEETVKLFDRGIYTVNIHDVLKSAVLSKSCKCIYVDIVRYESEYNLYYLGKDENGKEIYSEWVSKINTYVIEEEDEDEIWCVPIELKAKKLK